MGDEGRMSLEFDRQALVSIFTAEASDGLDKLSAAVTPPTSDSSPVPDVMHQLFIVAHSLKGAAALYGYETASALAGILEKAFEQAVAEPRQPVSAPEEAAVREPSFCIRLQPSTARR